MDGVISWGKLTLEWYTYELGSDSDLSIIMRDVLANPQSHSAWGTRLRQRVKILNALTLSYLN